MGKTKLRADGANNYPLCPRPLNNKTTNHDVVARLNKGAGGNVSESCSCWRSVWLERHSSNDSGGKGGSYPGRSNLKNAASQGPLFPTHICDKQIVRAINSQTIWISQSRRKDASQTGRSKFIDCPVHWG